MNHTAGSKRFLHFNIVILRNKPSYLHNSLWFLMLYLGPVIFIFIASLTGRWDRDHNLPFGEDTVAHASQVTRPRSC